MPYSRRASRKTHGLGKEPDLEAGARLRTVKVAIPQRGLPDTAMPFVIGDNAEFYKKEGVHLQIVWTREGGETDRAPAAARGLPAAYRKTID